MNISGLPKEQCSACGLCSNICPQKCISMMPDELGYVYPVVNETECVDCGLCFKKCIIYNPIEIKEPDNSYAAIRKELAKVSQSSSGGVFAAVAESVVSKGKWAVVGSTLLNGVDPKHRIAFSVEDLSPMYGSKYVQSDITDLFLPIKELLSNGYNVLFSGTPCQVAAIKRYANNHAGLYTIEVICHGVPNKEMFHSYLSQLDDSIIERFVFRDKAQGWSFNNKIVYKGGRIKKVNHRLSSYMTYFLNGETYRDSCYDCPYACSKRGADITIGDFWGIIKKRPDLKSKIDIEKGVSCLMINTEKGRLLLEESPISYYDVDYNDIKEGNEPLNHPSIHSSKRKEILSIWALSHSWKDVDNYWKKNDFKIVFKIWDCIPKWMQHRIRVALGKR